MKCEEVMKLHVNECEECKKEYYAKKAFQSDINSIDNMNFKRRALPKAIVASIIIIFTVSFVALSKPIFGYNLGEGLTNIINSFRNSFGSQFVASKELAGTGEMFEIEGVKIDIRSLAYSKTDLSVFFTLEDTNNTNNGCTLGDVQIMVDGEPCSYQGNQGQNYSEHISFGDFNISLPDDKVPSEMELKISDIHIEENTFNKLLINEEKTRVIEGEWIIPIKLSAIFKENVEANSGKLK